MRKKWMCGTLTDHEGQTSSMTPHPNENPTSRGSARALFVTATAPWPLVSGNRRRLQAVLRGLATAAHVDVMVFRGDGIGGAPGDLPIHVAPQGPAPTFVRDRRAQVEWLTRRVRAPSELVGLDAAPLRRHLDVWLAESGRTYDLVWYDRPVMFLALGRLAGARAIVDFDDLQDRKLTGRQAIDNPEDGTWGGPKVPGWRRLARYKSGRNVLGWRRLQESIAAQVDFVTVCSDDDALALGVPNAAQVPNSYPTVAQPLGRVDVGTPPTLSLVGLQTYRPNRDAAEWFTTAVFPIVRRSIPDVELRIVGEAGQVLNHLRNQPGVTVTGRVDRIDDELARADASLAPIRFGGGTRLKILEAWAHRIPVVATSIGAAGLGAVNEINAMIADDAADFAQACVRVLTDRTLRARLVEGGARRHLDAFTPERTEMLIGALVSDTIGSSRRTP